MLLRALHLYCKDRYEDREQDCDIHSFLLAELFEEAAPVDSKEDETEKVPQPDEDNAATKIQAAFRGMQVRN